MTGSPCPRIGCMAGLEGASKGEIEGRSPTPSTCHFRRAWRRGAESSQPCLST